MISTYIQALGQTANLLATIMATGVIPLILFQATVGIFAIN